MNHSNYFKLTKQPLLFVLAEFRFPIIMKMESFIPEIQEKLRQDFPHFVEQTAQEIKVQPQGMEVTSSKQWAFIDKNHQNALVLNQTRMICVTSAYNRFDGFKDFCKTAIEVLSHIAKPAFIERIGLRYADLIVPEQGQNDVSKYIKPSLYDSNHLQNIGTLDHKFNETLLTTKEGMMFIRSLYGKHNLSTLQDVNDLPVKLPVKDNNIGMRIILDFDHIWESQDKTINFEQSDILNKLQKMHLLSRQAFWDCTTEEGRELWK